MDSYQKRLLSIKSVPLPDFRSYQTVCTKRKSLGIIHPLILCLPLLLKNVRA